MRRLHLPGQMTGIRAIRDTVVGNVVLVYDFRSLQYNLEYNSFLAAISRKEGRMLNMTMENPPFEDVFPIANKDVSLPCYWHC